MQKERIEKEIFKINKKVDINLNINKHKNI